MAACGIGEVFIGAGPERELTFAMPVGFILKREFYLRFGFRPARFVGGNYGGE